MKAEAALIEQVKQGDETAFRTLVERYAAPLFRYCRLNLDDHFRAGDFVECEMARWLRHVSSGEISASGIEDLFEYAFQRSETQRLSERGKGLSGKQRRILELMETLPLTERLALDLVWLEDHSREDVTKWLALADNTILETEIRFKKTLGSDEMIKEFLEYAAIQQSRQQAARRRSEQETAYRRSGEETVPRRSSTSPSTVRRAVSPRKTGESGRRTPSDSAEKTTGTPENTGGNSEGESGGTDAQRPKPRPRRRRVDPRKLDFEI